MTPEFTRNETLELMYKDKASAFRMLADHFEKLNEEYSMTEVIKFIREIADEQEAQAIVVNLRDEINKQK